MNDLLPILPDLSPAVPLIIAGPCSAESRSQTLTTSRQLHAAGISVFRAGVWKPRTRPGGFEGHGPLALQWLAEVKAETGMLTATEIGCAAHAEMAVEAGIDILWIGARTTTSPFAMQEIAEALRGIDRAVLVKNPVCPDLDLWLGAVERLYACGVRRLGAIHRGFKTLDDAIYRNTPHWQLARQFRLQTPGMPMICDPSHMGGSRRLIAPIAHKAITELGYDGLIVESHCNPSEALTDSMQQITPACLAGIVGEVCYQSSASSPSYASASSSQS